MHRLPNLALKAAGGNVAMVAMVSAFVVVSDSTSRRSI
jgi:hypothetical protein